MSPFEGENMETQDNVLSYRVDLYFHDSKLATEIDKNVHSHRNIDYAVNRLKVIDQKFIRIDLDEEDFYIFSAINVRFTKIKESTKKSIINKISIWLLGLESNTDNIMKSKAMKTILKKIYCLIINNNSNILHHL